jgi:serine/arginine repetitive matrix protein 2
MASLMDLSSSPDPLGEDIAASVRPSTVRRSAKSLLQPSYLQSSAISTASARTLPSSAKSPRRQTFELDVGNPGSPQRLLVTVEADEQRGRRSALSRRLFAASPTRSPSRGRGPTTTTTTVPLRGLSDDEGGVFAGEEPAPRRRGRPRGSLGSKNGTPAPRGKKRAGTPLHRTSKAKRHSADPTADSAMLSDALDEAYLTVAGDPTPKPKPRERKTPRKAGTPAAPSSKPTTARKRGRPRKALLPNEMAVMASEAELRPDKPDVLPNEDAPMPGDAPSEAGIHVDRNDIPPADEFTHDVNGPADPHYPPGSTLDSEPVDGGSVHGGRAGGFDAPYSEDYMPLADPHSDLESEAEDVDSLTYSGQDNLTHASEFSMITLENLPSFQASFQGNLSRISEGTTEFPEAGEETNFIINQTLESLRRSTQSESQDQTSHGLPHHQGEGQEATTTLESPAGDARNSSANLGLSQISWIRSSARRPKQLPLSRQVFTSTKTPHVDDSFSSIAEGGLPTATPRRLPMSRPAPAATNEDPDMYDDSFSEIPDDVLLAATPKPASRTTTAANEDQEDQSDPPTSDRELHSASRSTNIGSDRLPTPDDTNSSATDAGKNTAAEGTQGMAATDVSMPQNTSDLGIRSSPPTISRQFNTMKLLSDASQAPPTISRQFNTMNLQSDASQAEQDAAGTPRRKSSSPQLPPTQSATAEHANNTLQPPAPIRRPTLSPIVRAGRTLQNIMSDRSSPEGRESSLGSPFRGPIQNDSRQSSVTKSPGRDANPSNSQFFNPIASLSQSIRSAFASSHRSVPVPAPTSAAVVGQADDPFGPDMPDYSQTEALMRSAYAADNIQGSQQPEFIPSVTSSTRAALPSSENDGIDWLANQSSPATQRFRRMSASQRSAHSSFLSTRASRSHLRVHVEHPDEQDEADEQDDQEPEEDPEEDQGEIEQEKGEEEEGEEEEEQEQPDEEDEEEEEAEQKEEEIEEEEVDQGVEDQLGEEEHHGEGHTQIELADELIDEPQQDDDGISDQGMAEPQYEDEDDEMDLWDIEASRPTPRSTKVLRAEAQSRRQTQAQPQPMSPSPAIADLSTADANSIPPRRTKIPSPWRRSTRRLIYQDDFKDPSEIEMDDSPPSDMEIVVPEPQPVALPEQPQEQLHEQPQEQRKMQHEGPREQHMDVQEDVGKGNQEMDEDIPDYAAPHHDDSDGGSYDVEPQEVVEPVHPSRVPQPQKHDVSTEESTMEDFSMASHYNKAPELPAQEQPAPARRSFFGNFDIMSFFSSPRPPPTKTVVEETPSQQTATRPLPKPIRSVEKPVPQEEPHSALRATGLFPSIPQKAFNPSPERRVDLFSPDATLRSADTVRTIDLFSPGSPLRPAESVPDMDVSSPMKPQGKPSIIADADLPSPGVARGQPDVVANANFSPADALTSTDTVADTYADTPSTPERGAFPPIPQKRNFTPLSAQSRNTASLFTPSRQGSTPIRDTKTPSPENDVLQEPDVSEPEMSLEISDPTDEPSFEHIPPRENPSNWDKTLSPTKSCLRSPLKPKTPGRVVEFTSNVLAPGGQAQARDDRQRALNTLSNLGNGGTNANRGNALMAQRPILPAPIMVPEGNKENSLSPPTPSPRRVVSFDALAPAPRLAANTGNVTAMAKAGSRSPTKQARSHAANPSASSPRTRLSPTNWTREHWIRLDELARLRRSDPLRFQMKFGGGSGSNKPHPLVGLEVATGQASLVLEPWHLEVVGAFRDSVLLPDDSHGEDSGTVPWDDRALSKRLFALLVGEERRRKGEIVSSLADKGKGKAVAAPTANPAPTAAAGAAAAAAMASVAGRGQRTGVRTSPRRR